MEKWNNEKGCFEPYTVPSTWRPLVYTSKRDFINCASCGKVIWFCKSKPSKIIINSTGFGYGICQECHDAEQKKLLKERFG